MPQSLASLHIHFVWGTKNRQPWLHPAVAEQLYPYIGGITRSFGSTLIRAGGMPDHIHLLISLGREASVAEAARLVKANSSKWLHDTMPGLTGVAWQSGYGAFAVSYPVIEQVVGYIANQAVHHQNRTFQDEYREFLRRHRIEFDERYVWD